ncbi:MAG: 3-oxoacyl-[acyl-carrier-protein] synthase-1 [Phenylobacterium sp.]|jgi:3-oxoacyl-[acyl-carrier-protein] synthase-1
MESIVKEQSKKQLKIILSDVGIVSAMGSGKQAHWDKMLTNPADGLSYEADWIPEKNVRIGRVNSPLCHIDDQPLAQTRCKQLLHATFAQIKPTVDAAIAQYGASRVGVVLGTSTSGTLEAENAFSYFAEHQQMPPGYHLTQQEMGSPSQYLAQLSGVKGIDLCISTACSSGAKALISASNLIKTGIVDAVIVGGVDSLCHLTINGFATLESLSDQICNPLSVNRKGINIGEGAALFLMQQGRQGVALNGIGESSDAHHMSAPHPEGDGAFAAMQNALTSAGLTVDQLDYINLHGTATPKNDAMETKAITRLGAQGVACSSTKPYTGHTLAGAGAIEAGFCWLAMSDFNPQHRLPPHYFDGQYDSEIDTVNLVDQQGNRRCSTTPIKHCLSNSFAFGGSNASLLFSKVKSSKDSEHDQ